MELQIAIARLTEIVASLRARIASAFDGDEPECLWSLDEPLDSPCATRSGIDHEVILPRVEWNARDRALGTPPPHGARAAGTASGPAPSCSPNA